ncbi:LexA family protein [Spirosoma foliorum]|uniref:DNA repair protein n=1 Tax=Spirosoma foliorum TaxID=2710596 RepID=A0A7G5GTU2_9BACT|nr:S24 family peptidase [Spirosoma foliorum]QMW02284.1 DNA repair protein [Spirosoma foliorum]
MIETIDFIPPEDIFLVDPTRRKDIPYFDIAVSAGFANPADNYIRERLNLQDLCVPHIDCTYFVRAKGESMLGDYIFPGSILVVDSTRPIETGMVIVIWVNEGWCVKRYIDKNPMIMLESSNEKYAPIYLHPDRDKISVLGEVTYIVSKPPRYGRPR